MSSYVALCRPSFFRVKDPTEFEAFCKRWEIRMIRRGRNGELFGFLGDEETGIPYCYYDAAKDEYADDSFMDELGTHLADGWVAVVREIGYEKMRYLVGYAVAVNSRGQSIEVSLDDIYDDAKRLGEHITTCEY